jgi:peptidoglycan hydrolase-like protein with peptidoglycan-binding domain
MENIERKPWHKANSKYKTNKESKPWYKANKYEIHKGENSISISVNSEYIQGKFNIYISEWDSKYQIYW